MAKDSGHWKCRQETAKAPSRLRDGKVAGRQKYFSGQRILPANLKGGETVTQIIEGAFLAYNSARLKEACRLFVERMLQPDVTIGISLAGALTPAGLGCSCIVPLIKAGFVDWIVSTGANLYHDLHFALNCPVRVGRPEANDLELRANELVRVYDVFLGFNECLVATDEILCSVLARPEFQREMGTAELHYLLGKHAAQWEKERGLKDVSILAAAYRAGVPCYTSSPGDSAIGMNMAVLQLRGSKLRINPVSDVNETAAYVLAAKRAGGKSAVVLWGGGSPKNFMLQTEPQIQEVLHVKDGGHDYFLQVTDARPDTGGLSGATPSEAVSWGKVDPASLPFAVVCYTDITIAMPLLTSYALTKHKPRRLKRLYHQREQMVKALTREYFAHNKVKMLDGSEPMPG